MSDCERCLSQGLFFFFSFSVCRRRCGNLAQIWSAQIGRSCKRHVRCIPVSQYLFGHVCLFHQNLSTRIQCRESVRVWGGVRSACRKVSWSVRDERTLWLRLMLVASRWHQQVGADCCGAVLPPWFWLSPPPNPTSQVRAYSEASVYVQQQEQVFLNPHQHGFIPLSLHTVPCWGSQPPFSSAAHPPTHTHPRQSVFRTRHNAATHRLLPRVKERKKGERSLIHMLRSSVKLVWGESIETSERRKRKIRYWLR